MMFARLALAEDYSAVSGMIRNMMAESRPDLVYDEEVTACTYQAYLTRADPTFWVVEQRREAIAFLAAGIYTYRTSRGLYTTQEALYVEPAKRGSRAATLLMIQLIAWSERLGALEIIGGNDNGFQTEHITKFLKHFDFVNVGNVMRRAVS